MLNTIKTRPFGCKGASWRIRLLLTWSNRWTSRRVTTRWSSKLSIRVSHLQETTYLNKLSLFRIRWVANCKKSYRKSWRRLKFSIHSLLKRRSLSSLTSKPPNLIWKRPWLKSSRLKRLMSKFSLSSNNNRISVKALLLIRRATLAN